MIYIITNALKKVPIVALPNSAIAACHPINPSLPKPLLPPLPLKKARTVANSTEKTISATASVGSQVFVDSITAEAKRTADKVSEKLADFFARQGWI